MNEPDSLSSGQKKLLVLCRALMLKPRLALLDEPVAGVNPVLVGENADFIRSRQAEDRRQARARCQADPGCRPLCTKPTSALLTAAVLLQEVLRNAPKTMHNHKEASP